MTEKKKFLIKHEATCGRTKADGGQHPTVTINFYSIIEAQNEDEVNQLIASYNDATFKTRVVDIKECPPFLNSKDLLDMLQHRTVFVEETF